MRHISFFISPADEDDPSRRIIIAGLERRAKRRYVDKGKCWRIASVGFRLLLSEGGALADRHLLHPEKRMGGVAA